jgi:hypothetical protein
MMEGKNMESTINANTKKRMDYCLVERYHSGDENGKSNAVFAQFELPDEAKEAGFFDVWLEPLDSAIKIQESDKKGDKHSVVNCENDPAEVIIRRRHEGDENDTTTYYLAKVIAAREVSEGKTEQYTCVAVDHTDDTTPTRPVKEDRHVIHNDKESHAGWVKWDGEVIVRRDHYGDENGATNTSFSAIYIKVDGKAKYKLNLINHKTLGEQKESSSDFYVKTYDKGTKFQAWYAPTESVEQLDHTWIDSVNPADIFSCTGTSSLSHIKDDAKYMQGEYLADDQAHDIAKFCRGENDTNHIDPYGIDGVCHQMANRFLYPVGRTLYIDERNRPNGYTMSSIAYGKWGHSFHSWLKGTYAEAKDKAADNWIFSERQMAPGTLEYELEKVYVNADADEPPTDLLIQATGIMLAHYIPGLTTNPIASEQAEFMKTLYELAAKNGIIQNDGKSPKPERAEIVSFYEKVNRLGQSLQDSLRSKIGANEYKSLNGNKDVLYDFVDIELAVQLYKK